MESNERLVFERRRRRPSLRLKAVPCIPPGGECSRGFLGSQGGCRHSIGGQSFDSIKIPITCVVRSRRGTSNRTSASQWQSLIQQPHGHFLRAKESPWDLAFGGKARNRLETQGEPTTRQWQSLIPQPPWRSLQGGRQDVQSTAHD